MSVLFLRHGETYDNLNDVFSGQNENPDLTVLGITQARVAGHVLKSMQVARIICTSLRRSRRSAYEIATITSVGPVDVDDRIIEYDMGVLGGTPGRPITSAELVTIQGAEDPYAFQNRVLSSLRDYKGMPGNTLLVSHACVGRIIEASRLGLPPEEFYSVPKYPNAQVIELDLSWLT